MDDLSTRPAYVPPPGAAGPFVHSRFHFMTGMPAGETARIRDDEGNVLLTYRSFASVVGIVAALVAGIVVMTGLAAAVFLVLEEHPLTSIGALVLSVFFSLLIVALVPPVKVTLHDAAAPALVIAQRSRAAFPSVTHAVMTPGGQTIALLRKSFFARAGRNRWTMLDPAEHVIGSAAEESLGRALVRKVAGKFSRAFQSNVRIDSGGRLVATIVRRPNARGEVDVLDCTPDLDRRIAVALGTLILGSET